MMRKSSNRGFKRFVVTPIMAELFPVADADAEVEDTNGVDALDSGTGA